MIIGNGDIAWALREYSLDRDDFVFFAAGVSHSGILPETEYLRERNLLLKQERTEHLIYFSSLCVFSPGSRYADHKRVMEELVKDTFPLCTILRLGNITWGTNPTTLINHLRAHPDAPLQDTYRYICDLDEFQHWIRLIPAWSCEMNIPGRRMLVKDIYQEFVVNARERA